MFGSSSGVTFNPATDIAPCSLDGKVIIVTGGNIGLGRETVLQLAKHHQQSGGPHIYLAARNREKAETAIQEIQAATSSKAKVTFLELDLASFASIKAAARTFTSENKRLDILINNAGVMACAPTTTAEGYEMQFGTNHVGHALFTKLLLPTLQSTASLSESAPGAVRIVNLSSAGESLAPSSSWTFDAMRSPTAGIGLWTRYGQSKLANIHYTRALATHYPGITSVAIHPGTIRTNLVAAGPGAAYPLLAPLMNVVGRLLLSDVKEGALNQLWAATAPVQGSEEEKNKAKGKGPRSGVFYWPVGVEGKDSAKAKDERLTSELWEWTEKQLEGHTMDS